MLSDQVRTDDDEDERWMRHAIRLAKGGQGHVEPNPMVGCVLVRDGQIIGEGFHGRFGGPHAEIVALEDARARGFSDVRGGTAYITLEPCCHVGKTPPCSQALIKAGLKRVVVAVEDPFPRVSGGGLKDLRSAGVLIRVGVLGAEANEILAPFAKRVQTGIPWTIAKWAMTADGRIATTTGESQWITGGSSRRDVHQTRGRVDAIIVGMGTVNADDPLLTARPPGHRIATRVIVCRQSLPNANTKLVQTAADMATLVYAPAALDPARQSDLRASGVDIRGYDPGDAKDSLRVILSELANDGATNVLLECGGRLMSSFFEADLIDEFHVYIGAMAFGGYDAPGPLGGIGKSKMDQAPRLKVQSVERFGDDVKIVYRRM